MINNKQHIVSLEYGECGLPYVEPLDGSTLTAESSGKKITIRGNANGLLFLAHQLIALAKLPNTLVDSGYHVHLDDLYEINKDGIEFILRRQL